nr:hypothetical protein [Tanacetum cinerariifolium]
MMNKFLASVGLDRKLGFTSLEMTASKTSSDPISIVFKKRTLYEVAIHDVYQLYEIGLKDDGLRHFKDASFMKFGESYPQMVGSLHGLRIDREGTQGHCCESGRRTKVAISTNEQFCELTHGIKDAKDASHAPFKKEKFG